jgi:hypothetical protein
VYSCSTSSPSGNRRRRLRRRNVQVWQQNTNTRKLTEKCWMGCSSELGNYFDDEAAGHPSAADDQDLDPGPARRNSGQGTRWHQAASVSAGRAPHTGPHRAPQRRRTAAHTPMARCTGNSTPPICTSSSWMRPTRSRQEASPARSRGTWCDATEGGSGSRAAFLAEASGSARCPKTCLRRDPSRGPRGACSWRRGGRAGAGSVTSCRAVILGHSSYWRFGVETFGCGNKIRAQEN